MINQLLESFALAMPIDSSSGSSSSNLAGFGVENPKIKKGRGSDSAESRGPPVIRVTRVLVQGMTPLVDNEGDCDHNKKDSVKQTNQRMHY